MLYRAFLLLSMSFFLAMDGTMAQTTGYDTGAVTTAIANVDSPGPAPVTTTTYLNVNFFHDTVTGSYAVAYYFAGCNTLNPLPATTGLTNLATTTAPDGYTFSTTANPTDTGSNTCGVTNVVPCGAKSTYQYKLQLLNAITHPDIKSGLGTPGSPFMVKFCVRHRLLDDAGIERGYKEADVTVRWTSSSGFTGADVSTTENGPDNEDVDVGAVSVQAAKCSNLANPSVIPGTYNQGEKIQICLSASVTGSSARVIIVEVNELRFWIDKNVGGGSNGVYDDGEVTQVGISTNSAGVTAEQGTTKLIPADVIGAGTGTCDEPFSTYFPAGNALASRAGCILETFLLPPFFPTTGASTVQYSGRVTVQFFNGNRRVLQLKNGDLFPKPFGSEVTVLSRDTEDDSCECGGFFFFFCIIMCFITSIIG